MPARPLGAEHPTTALMAGDVLDLPFDDASFDAIFASALLQHLPDPSAALREARRVARPGAVIGVVDADWDGEQIEEIRRARTDWGRAPGAFLARFWCEAVVWAPS